MTTSNRGLKQRVFLAFKENLILTLYLWAVFLLLVVYKSTILAEQHIDFVYHGAALITIASVYEGSIPDSVAKPVSSQVPKPTRRLRRKSGHWIPFTWLVAVCGN